MVKKHLYKMYTVVRLFAASLVTTHNCVQHGHIVGGWCVTLFDYISRSVM